MFKYGDHYPYYTESKPKAAKVGHPLRKLIEAYSLFSKPCVAIIRKA